MKRVAARKQPVGGAGKLDAGMTTASVVCFGWNLLKKSEVALGLFHSIHSSYRRREGEDGSGSAPRVSMCSNTSPRSAVDHHEFS